MKLKKRTIKRLEEAGFRYTQEDDGTHTFSRCSPEGQDFSFSVEDKKDLGELADEVYDYWNSFDPSEAAYIWLDSSGHGKNGAPYEMGDVYDDMVVCEGYIDEVYDILEEEWQR